MEKNQFEVQELTTILGEIAKNPSKLEQNRIDAAKPCAAHHEEEK